MLFHLKPLGRAGIVLANGSMSSSQNSEGDIRRAMVVPDIRKQVLQFSEPRFPVLPVLHRHLVHDEPPRCLRGL
jgi:hypothetical protein